MEVTEEDSPAIRQCKCAISKELRSRWSLNSIDPTSPGSDLVAVCLDPWFQQAKFLESHHFLDLQMAITDLVRREIEVTEQQQQLTTEKESDSRLKALDLLLRSDSPASSSDSSDPLQDEVENYFNPLTTDDAIWHRLSLAACYQLVQFVLKIGFALAKKAG